MKIYALYCLKCGKYLSTCHACSRVDSYLAKNRNEAWKELEAQAEQHDAYIHPDDSWMQIELRELKSIRKVVKK